MDITTREFATNQEQPDLITYATSNAYLFFRQQLASRTSGDIVVVGSPQSSPTVTAVDMNSTPHGATVTDCFGGPDYKPVFAADNGSYKKGESALPPGSKLAAHLVTATLEDKGDHWVVVDYTVSDKTC